MNCHKCGKVIRYTDAAVFHYENNEPVYLLCIPCYKTTDEYKATTKFQAHFKDLYPTIKKEK